MIQFCVGVSKKNKCVEVNLMAGGSLLSARGSFRGNKLRRFKAETRKEMDANDKYLISLFQTQILYDIPFANTRTAE